MTTQTIECIYCLQAMPKRMFTKEHVIPQAFGTFENNLTLVNCVCSDCNQFFGASLEQIAAEGSHEALLRLVHGIKPAESAKSLRKDRLHFSLSGGKWNGLAVWPQGDGDKPFAPTVPQVGFAKKDGSDWIYFTESELADLSEPLPQEIDTKQISLLYDLEGTKEQVIQTLLKLGIKYREYESGPLPQDEVRESKVKVKTQIDTVILRCMAKIAFNYLAKTAGDDFVRKRDFNSIRSYIRYGTAPNYDFLRISSPSMVAYDTLVYSQTNGHLVTVNWSPDDRDIVSKVSPFNHRTYIFRLAMSFSGLWRPIKSGHHFNIERRTVETII